MARGVARAPEEVAREPRKGVKMWGFDDCDS